MANLAPDIAIASPAPDALFETGASIVVTASASDPDGAVTAVVFSVDGGAGGTATVPPHVWASSNLAVGWHVVAAQAADDAGAVSAVATVSVGVNPPHGTPLPWLEAHGITNDFAAAETRDADGDGMAAWAEYWSGTDPTNRGSAFKVMALRDRATLTWLGGTNADGSAPFRMYRRTNMLAGQWDLVDSNILRSASGSNTWTDPSPPGSAPVFYRPAVPCR